MNTFSILLMSRHYHHYNKLRKNGESTFILFKPRNFQKVPKLYYIHNLYMFVCTKIVYLLSIVNPIFCRTVYYKHIAVSCIEPVHPWRQTKAPQVGLSLLDLNNPANYQEQIKTHLVDISEII